MKSRRRESALRRSWRRTGPNGRLGTGLLVVLALWFAGLVYSGMALPEIAWPSVVLVAAVGWSRVGLALRPMVALVLLGLLQDLAHAAPLGSYVMVALCTYWFHAALERALDLDRDPMLATLAPFISLAAGIVMIWIIASSIAGHAAAVLPLILTGLTSALTYTLIHPLLDLQSRPGELAGRA